MRPSGVGRTRWSDSVRPLSSCPFGTQPGRFVVIATGIRSPSPGARGRKVWPGGHHTWTPDRSCMHGCSKMEPDHAERGDHAELQLFLQAREVPGWLFSSNDFCHLCEEMIRAAGGVVVPDVRASAAYAHQARYAFFTASTELADLIAAAQLRRQLMCRTTDAASLPEAGPVTSPCHRRAAVLGALPLRGGRHVVRGHPPAGSAQGRGGERRGGDPTAGRVYGHERGVVEIGGRGLRWEGAAPQLRAAATSG